MHLSRSSRRSIIANASATTRCTSLSTLSTTPRPFSTALPRPFPRPKPGSQRNLASPFSPADESVAFLRETKGRLVGQNGGKKMLSLEEEMRSLERKGEGKGKSDKEILTKPLLPPSWIEQYVKAPKAKVTKGESSTSTSSSPPPMSSSILSSAPPDEPNPSPPPDFSSPALTSASTSVISAHALEVLSSTLASSLHASRHIPNPPLSSSARQSGPIEPVVGVYSPYEGGMHVLDGAMEEAASKLDADLVVLDAIELAAEGQGALGFATAAIPFTPNPLKLTRYDPKGNLPSSSSRRPWEDDDDLLEEEDEDEFEVDEEEEDDESFRERLWDKKYDADNRVGSSSGTRDSLWKAGAERLAAASAETGGEIGMVEGKGEAEGGTKEGQKDAGGSKAEEDQDVEEVTTPRSTQSPHLVLKKLFNEIVNASPASTSPSSSAISTPSSPTSPTSSSSSTSTARPRILYIQNASLLAQSIIDQSSTSEAKPNWYRHLLSAVQDRRRFVGPTSIALGISPSILEKSPSDSSAKTEFDPKATSSAPVAPAMSPFMQGMFPPSLRDILGEPPWARKPSSSASSPEKVPENLYACSPEGWSESHRQFLLERRIQAMKDGQWGSIVPNFNDRSPSSNNHNSPSLPGLPPGLPPSLVGFMVQVKGDGDGGSDSSFPFSPKSSGATAVSNKLLWKVVGVFPKERSMVKEKEERARQRNQINELLCRIAAAHAHVALSEPLPVGSKVAEGGQKKVEEKDGKEADGDEKKGLDGLSETVEKGWEGLKETAKDAKKELDKIGADPKSATQETKEAFKTTTEAPKTTEAASKKDSLRLPEAALDPEQVYDNLLDRFARTVLPWEEVCDLVFPAAGLAAFTPSNTSPASQPLRPAFSFITNAPPLTWSDVARTAFHAQQLVATAPKPTEESAADADVSSPTTSSDTSGPKSASDDKAKKDEAAKVAKAKPDPVVVALKADPKLNSYEKRILSTIVDTRQLNDGFDNVHLPDDTIDALRTAISLPLLQPEAFNTGILKTQASSGALLFGPPGTGKTLLARALAKESGARMMSIRGSDVQDKYFGESEKIVKAVFSVARRLSPCIIFVDELDSMFSSRSDGPGNNARRDTLVEFMQEMDGLTSSKENREKSLVVIGATNRPQDLDEAVLRRLPRRVMVDLPNAKAREAILRILLKTEKLAPEVDLVKLAKDTENYSGSDLRHLCVLAAQEAVKEMFDVPWKTKTKTASPEKDKENDKSPSEDGQKDAPAAAQLSSNSSSSSESISSSNTPSSTSAAPPSSSDSSSAPPTPSSKPAPGPFPSAGNLPTSPSPTASSSSFLSSTTTHPSTSTSSSHPPASPDSDPSPDTTIQIAKPVESFPLTTADKPDTDTDTAHSTTPPAKHPSPPTPASPAPSIARPPPPERVLTKAHFDRALKNSNSSGSDESGAASQLKKWNDQYGDSGKNKNKKSGFGARFGFVDKPKADKAGGDKEK